MQEAHQWLSERCWQGSPSTLGVTVALSSTPPKGRPGRLTCLEQNLVAKYMAHPAILATNDLSESFAQPRKNFALSRKHCTV